MFSIFQIAISAYSCLCREEYSDIVQFCQILPDIVGHLIILANISNSALFGHFPIATIPQPFQVCFKCRSTLFQMIQVFHNILQSWKLREENWLLKFIYMAHRKVNSPKHLTNGKFFFETPPNKGLFINYVIQSGCTGGKPKDATR